MRGVQPMDPSRQMSGDGGGEEEVWRMAEERKRRNGFSEMPCSRCPVSDMCAPGGLVSAATCVYFEEWLGESAAVAA